MALLQFLCLERNLVCDSFLTSCPSGLSPAQGPFCCRSPCSAAGLLPQRKVSKIPLPFAFPVAEWEVRRAIAALSMKKSAMCLSLARAWSSEQVLLDFYTGWILQTLVNWKRTWNRRAKEIEAFLSIFLCLQSFEGFSVFRNWNLKRETVYPCVVLGKRVFL